MRLHMTHLIETLAQMPNEAETRKLQEKSGIVFWALLHCEYRFNRNSWEQIRSIQWL